METPMIQKVIHRNLYEVDIDFDLASKAWRANKRSVGDGSFKYKVKHVGLKAVPTTNARYNLRPRIPK